MTHKLARSLSRFGTRHLVLLAFSAAIASCAGPTGLRIDKSFTNASLKDGKMGIGGVVHLTNPGANQQQPRWTELFTKVIEARKYNFTVVPPGPLADSIGEPLLKRAKDEYGKGGLSVDTLGSLQGQALGVRYLVLGRVQSDQVTTERYEVFTEDKASKKPRQKAIPVSSIRRTLAMHVDVYDLEIKQSVWSGVFTEDDENSTDSKNVRKNKNHRPAPGPSVGDIRASDGITGILKTLENRDATKYPGFPPAPSIAEVMVDIFDAVAYHLPKW